MLHWTLTPPKLTNIDPTPWWRTTLLLVWHLFVEMDYYSIFLGGLEACKYSLMLTCLFLYCFWDPGYCISIQWDNSAPSTVFWCHHQSQHLASDKSPKSNKEFRRPSILPKTAAIDDEEKSNQPGENYENRSYHNISGDSPYLNHQSP